MNKVYSKIIDIFFIFILSAICWEIIAFMQHGSILNPGYEDWMAHAYRVELLARYGYTSWIHNWSNGISVWNSYQFIPHYITLAVVKLFSVSITNAMIYLTIFQFIFLRIIIYVVLRSLKFSVLSSFLTALLSLSIAQYWEGVGDYSLLFGFTLFPLFLWFWIKYYNNKFALLYPYLCGLSFYIHPLLGITLCGLWLLGNILSSKAIISKSLLLEFLIILTTSSLFWLPILQSSQYTFKNPYLASQEYLVFTLKDYAFYGLNLYIIILYVASFFVLFAKRTTRNWTKVLVIYALLNVILVLLGTKIGVPEIIAQTQFTRGVFFIGITMLFVIASLLQEIISSRYLILKIILAFLVTTAFVDGLWYATIHSPAPGNEQNDPVYTIYNTNVGKPLHDGRLWSPHIGSSSYYAGPEDMFSYSYMGHLEPNELAQRLGQHLLYANQTQSLTISSTQTINNYLQITGTKYLLLDHNNTFSTSFIENNLDAIDSVKLVEGKNEDFDFITMSWPTVNARIVSPDIINLPPFPRKADITLFSDQKRLDDLVALYAGKLLQNRTTLPVTYPKNDQLTIAIPATIPYPYIFVNESYDPNWHGKIGDSDVKITSFGPNFMIITLPKGGSGTLVLKHTWPITHWVSLFLIYFIGLFIPIYSVGKKYLKKHESN